MKRLFAAVIFSAGVLVGTAQPGRCDAQAEMVRALAAKYKSSLVTLKLVVKTDTGYGNTQSEMEADGILISTNGLVVTTNTAIDPMSMYTSALGDEDGGGMSSAVVSIKILTASGAELPAKVVLRDKDGNMAFVRPVHTPSKPLPAISFTGAVPGTARMGDPVYVLGRLGKAGGRNAEVKQVRIVSIIDKPRRRYVLDPYTYIYPGNVVFNEQGKPLGMLSMRVGRSGRMSGSKPSDGFLSIVIPAADVWEVALQAPQAKNVRGIDASGSTPTPAKPAARSRPNPK